MSIFDDMDLLLKCAPGAPCPCEEACFRVVRELQDRLHAEPPPTYAAVPPADDDVIADYAPDWENRRGFMPCREG